MKNSLSEYAYNKSSQFGEDGVVQRIFDVLPTQNRYWCVEFGAWDGKYLSNTHDLVENHHWHGVFIEVNKKKFPDLQSTYSTNTNAHLINKLVNYEGKDKLDDILAETPIPHDFNLLSIDIDGNDCGDLLSDDVYGKITNV